MTQTFFVRGPFPGLNDLIAAAKGAGGRGAVYAALKRRWTTHVANVARGARLRPVTGVNLHFTWHEKNRRRDPDNVAAGGRKLVLDGLVAAKVLGNDGWNDVISWSDSWMVSAESPGVEVTMSGEPQEAIDAVSR